MLFYLSEEEAVNPKNGVTIANHWWNVEPEKGLIFFTPSKRISEGKKYADAAPQCNIDKVIAEHICKRLYPNAEVKFFSAVFLGYPTEWY